LAPKGLAAAALAGLPAAAGLPGGAIIQDTTYAVVLLSILVSSLGVAFLSPRTPSAKKTNIPSAHRSPSMRVFSNKRKKK
jgi:NhaP-type Na+/H+ or K+/H+ antiporter